MWLFDEKFNMIHIMGTSLGSMLMITNHLILGLLIVFGTLSITLWYRLKGFSK